MRKRMAWILVAVLICFISAQSVAETLPDGNPSAAVSVTNLPEAPAIAAKTKTASATFHLSPVPDASALDAFGQSSPAPVPQQQKHHGHIVRNLIIAVAAGAVLYVVLASADH